MTDDDFKYLPRRIASDKVLRDITFNIAKIQNMRDIIVAMLNWFINFFDEMFYGGAATRAQSDTLATRDKSAITKS